jgi:uroporphyrinogen decarboxylase
MTSVERIYAALLLEKTDRVPVVPQVIQHGLQFTGAVHSRYSINAKTMAKTVMAAQRYYGYDAVYVSTDNYILTEAFGSEIRFPEDAPPQLINYVMEDGNINNLKKADPQCGRLPIVLEATSICRKSLGDRVFVKTNIDSAPFSAAASVRGPESLMMDIYDDENNVTQLLDRCTDLIVAYGKAAAKAGAHGLAFGDSVAGLLSREQYERFALPWAKMAIAELKMTGLPVFYHVCGQPTHILDLMVATGADCLEIDSMITMKEMQKFAAGKCTLMGNIDTINIFLNGKPEQVRQEAFAIIDLFDNRGGLLLSSGCEVPRKTPRENMSAMVQSAVDYPYTG